MLDANLPDSTSLSGRYFPEKNPPNDEIQLSGRGNNLREDCSRQFGCQSDDKRG